MLLLFSLPWTTDSRNVPSITYRDDGRYNRTVEHNKVIPGPLSDRVLGKEPYTGWDLLPLTTPCLVALALGIFSLFVKKGSLAFAGTAGILLFTGIIFAGFTGAPEILTTWSGGGGDIMTFYGTGRPLFALSYWFTLLISGALAFIPIAKHKMDQHNRRQIVS